MTRRRVGIVLLAALIVVLILREMGVVDVNAYWNVFEWQTDSTMSRTSGSFVTTGTGASYTSQIKASADNATARRVLEALRKRSNASSNVPAHDFSLDLLRCNLRGAYWTPLYKSGSCTFAAKYEMNRGSVHIEGSIEGKVDFRVTGACSIYKLRQLIADQIAKEIEKEISKQEGKL